MPTPEALALLQQMVDLIDASDGDATDTEALAGATGRATFGPPWFEMREEVDQLRAEGLLEVDEASAERCTLVVTEAGRATLTPRNSE